MKRDIPVLAFLIGLAAFISFTGPTGPTHRHKHPTPTPSPSATPSPPTVTLAWDPSIGATGYRLWLGFAPGQETLGTDEGAHQSATITLTSGTTYYFVVTAYNGAGESGPSNEVSYSAP